jgi:hypothetical protein
MKLLGQANRLHELLIDLLFLGLKVELLDFFLN